MYSAEAAPRFLIGKQEYQTWQLYYYYYIDRQGKNAIKGPFCQAFDFSEGLALVFKDCTNLTLEDSWTNLNLEFIDENGTVAFRINGDLNKEQTFSHFSDGLVSIKRNNKCGYFNKKGVLVIDFKYDYCPPFQAGFAYVGSKEKFTLIDRTGKKVEFKEFPYDYFLGCSEEICLGSFKQGKSDYFYQFYDLNNKRRIPGKYRNARIFKDGLAAIQHNDFWGFIDKTGRQVIKNKFRDIRSFSNQIAAVKYQNDDYWYFIDKKGKKVSKSRFDYAWEFNNGLVLAEKPGVGRCYYDTKIKPVRCQRERN